MAGQGVRVWRSRPDHVFFPLIALAIAAVVVVGFAPSYFFKAFTDAPALNVAVHLHGALFSAWVALLVVQTLLIRSGRPAVHRRLGLVGVALAVLMVIAAGIVTLQVAPRFPEPGWLYAVTIGDLVMFIAFLALAVYYRNISAAHKRLMLLATVAIIDAAVIRWPVIAPFFEEDPASGIGSFWMWFGTDLPIAAGIIYDRIVHGGIHRAYLLGGSALVLSQALRFAVIDTPMWQVLSEVLLGLAA